MKLEAFSSRHFETYIDIDEPFTESIDENQEYCFFGGFTLKDEDSDDLIAIVEGYFFDEDKIVDEGQDIVDIADMLDADVYGAMYALTHSRLYKKEVDMDLAMRSLFSCYISRVFVYETYRGKGIGRYIFENLSAICLHCFNTQIHCFVICPKPQHPTDNNTWVDSEDKDGKMLKLMVSTIIKSGYRQISKTEFYAINCAASK